MSDWDDVWEEKCAMLEHVFFNSLPATWHDSDEVRDDAILAYTIPLRDLSPQQLAAAVDRVCKTHEFGWPVPAKIVSAAAEIKEERRARPENPPVAALPDSSKGLPAALIADKKDWVETAITPPEGSTAVVLIRGIPHALMPDGPVPYFARGIGIVDYALQRGLDDPNWLPAEELDKLRDVHKGIVRDVPPVDDDL